MLREKLSHLRLINGLDVHLSSLSKYLSTIILCISALLPLPTSAKMREDEIVIVMEESNKKYPGNKTYYKGLDKDTKAARAADIRRKSKMDLDDPSAYEPMPGDEKEPKRQSVYNKKFKDMFGERLDEVSFEHYIDMMDDLLGNPTGSASHNLLELLDTDDTDLIRESVLDENDQVTKALKNKAKKANAPLSALRAIYNKGLAAYRTGHRPGASQHAWAMARVNSVLVGGPARKVDKAEWERISKFRAKKRKKG